MVTPILFKKYPTPSHFAALQPEELEPDIRSTGFFRNKSKSIVGAAKKIVNDFGGEVPRTMDELLTIPGAARKTANVVLGSWFGIAVGVVVDTHVQRISRRLELTKNDTPPKIEQDLMRVIPRAKWIDFSHQIIHHGRAICIARKPKCAECPLENSATPLTKPGPRSTFTRARNRDPTSDVILFFHSLGQPGGLRPTNPRHLRRLLRRRQCHSSR